MTNLYTKPIPFQQQSRSDEVPDITARQRQPERSSVQKHSAALGLHLAEHQRHRAAHQVRRGYRSRQLCGALL